MSRPHFYRLLMELKARAYSTGKFRLSGGGESDYYVDSKKVFLSPRMLDMFGFAFEDLISDFEYNSGKKVQAVGGPELGAIPLVAVTILKRFESARHYNAGENFEGFVVRKEQKNHGTFNLIEGNLKPDDNVVIIDDVMTTGASAMKAVRIVEAVGAKVALVTCILDRQDGAAKTFCDYNFIPLFTIEQLRACD